MRKIRTYSQVADPAAEDIIAQVTVQADRLQARLAGVRQVVVVASGKGGVGKSALTANLACALAEGGSAIGAVDADLNGPSLARMLGASGQQLTLSEGAVLPARGTAGVSLISTDLLLPEGAPLRYMHGYGHYHETYEKSADGWRIKTMTITRLQRLVETAPPTPSESVG